MVAYRHARWSTASYVPARCVQTFGWASPSGVTSTDTGVDGVDSFIHIAQLQRGCQAPLVSWTPR